MKPILWLIKIILNFVRFRPRLIFKSKCLKNVWTKTRFNHIYVNPALRKHFGELVEIKKLTDNSKFYNNSEPTTGLEPVTSSLPRKHSTAELSRLKQENHTKKHDFCWAEDEGRTRDIQLGRLTLYQLSYFRNFVSKTIGNVVQT